MSLICHRCGVELRPGSGDFYEVRIEALADPVDARYGDERVTPTTGAP